ncbi:MAG: alpha/beta hydrolase [Gemmatimonadota bacterium]|nr:alpha/beta hydrolase [Gemmatimonadota bacterium]
MSTRPRLHVTRSGRPLHPDGETFLLLHGFGGSSFSWRWWTPALEHRGHVVQVDLLGFGRSPMPVEGPYDPEGQAGLVLDVLDGIDPARLTIVGHSFGGAISLLLALELQERGRAPERLVLVAGVAYRQRIPPFVRIARYPRLGQALSELVGVRTIMAQALRSVVFDTTSVTSELVTGYARPFTREGAIRAVLTCATRIQPPRMDAITALYPRLSMPTLLLWGRHDPVVPPWVGARLAHDLPNARLRTLERCGHLPQEELPEASLAEVEAFLDS